MEKGIAESIFDSVSKSYDRFLNLTTFRSINRWQDELVENTVLGKYVLDVGTGTGEMLKKIGIKSQDVKLIGVDVSMNMLKKAKEKLKNQNRSFLLIKADALSLPIKDTSLDNLFFSLVFRHLPSDITIGEVQRVLRKDGYVSILEIAKPESKIFYWIIYNFADKIFRPVGRVLFSEKQWNYFVESIKNSMTMGEFLDFFKKKGFDKHYYRKRFFGLIHIAVFKKGA